MLLSITCHLQLQSPFRYTRAKQLYPMDDTFVFATETASQNCFSNETVFASDKQSFE